jgi:hypothetical protein
VIEKTLPIIVGASLLLTSTAQANFSLSGAYDPDTFELKAKSWKEDWLYPLRIKKKPNVVQSTKENPHHFRYSAEKRSLAFSVPSVHSASNLWFEPNGGLYSVLSYNHAEKFGAAVSWKADSGAEAEKYGPTKYFDLRFDLPFGDWLLQTHYSRYLGFYLSNPQDRDPTWDPSSPYPQFPDLKATSLGVRAQFVVTPHRYSLNHLINQTSRQTRSGGSAILGLEVRQDEFGNGHSFLPGASLTPTSDSESLRSLKVTNLAASLGWGGYLALTKNVGAAMSFHYKWGPARIVQNFVEGKDTLTKPITHFGLDMSLGYNGITNYYGLRIESQSMSVPTRSSNFDTSLGLTSIYYGFRF